ncbi:MAG: ABC transporter substrate-binding protein, partial [Lachnospiraceae bacterium]|nr:ABC transporter substrate-binding protein [Lachnospiraceae bacterium]
MKMKKFLAAVLAASMVIGMLAGCGSDGSSESRKEAEAETEMEESNEEVAAEAADSSDGSLTEFKMTYVTWVGCAPLFIAQEKGFFEEHGIKPELILNEDESSGASLLYS